MKNKIIQKIITAIFFTGLLVVLKIYFDTPDIAIVFLLVLTVLAGLIRVVVFGYVIPPDWLYRMRFTVLGIGYGIFIGIMLFGMEAIENNTFIVQDFLKFILIGSVIGGIFNNTLSFSKSQKLERKKGLFLLERQLIKDFAQLIKPDGESINGKLVLTNDNLVFLDDRKNQKVLEKSIGELNPVINTMKFPGIPNGFKIENDEIIFKVPFPGYWLKRIEKRKQIKIAT
jgi:hypothetical protein